MDASPGLVFFVVSIAGGALPPLLGYTFELVTADFDDGLTANAVSSPRWCDVAVYTSLLALEPSSLLAALPSVLFRLKLISRKFWRGQ